MSTPQTLTQALPPYHHLDHPPRYIPSPQNRYLPPPRPSSNASNGFHHSIPARPSSNVSNHQLAPPPPRTHSGMSNAAYTHSHAHSQGQGQARSGAERQPSTNSLAHKSSHEELRRTNSAVSQPQHTHVPPASTSNHSEQYSSKQRDESSALGEMQRGRKRGRQSPVDWVAYFGGKPPAEIITIHDDDSPAPPASVQKLPPPTNGSTTSHHVDKKRRTNGGSGNAQYSATNTPYSLSHGTSSESLHTTAPTSLGSQASNSRTLDATQTGQKRKRTAKAAEPESKKQAIESRGPRGYLAEYGEYVPPPKQQKKQKEVNVPAIHDVSCMPMSYCRNSANLSSFAAAQD